MGAAVRNPIIIRTTEITPLTTLPIDVFPVPGLGFDFPHLAAISGAFRTRGLHNLHIRGNLRGVTPGVFFLDPFLAASSPAIIAQQPPVIVIQVPTALPETGEQVAESRAVQGQAAAEPAVPAEPPREVGEFVLVLRDGRLVFATAFSVEPGRITYVTRDAVRRTLPLTDLDIEATRRMNEERGTSISLPS